MCRSNVAPAAAGALGRLLLDMRDALAAEHGLDPAGVTIGPVDFGPDEMPAVSVGTCNARHCSQGEGTPDG